MAERPILFNGEMVRAILAGQKTQTRRAVKGVRGDNCLTMRKATKTKGGIVTHVLDATERGLCPFGQPGDRLWVRERFKPVASGQVKNGYGEIRYGYAYEADSSTRWNKRPTIIHDLTGQPSKGPMQFQQSPWRSSICMPHRACRILLEITAVRVERLQAISEADAIAEGADASVLPHIRLPRTHPRVGLPMIYAGHREIFADLWDSTGGDWDSNPWVWVIEFKRVEVGQ